MKAEGSIRVTRDAVFFQHFEGELAATEAAGNFLGLLQQEFG